MSQFSRRKHYNYANVVLEMKEKNERGGSYHRPRGGGGVVVKRGRSDEGVGTGWHTQFQQQQQQQQQHYSASSYETAPPRTEYDETNNGDDGSNRDLMIIIDDDGYYKIHIL